MAAVLVPPRLVKYAVTLSKETRATWKACQMTHATHEGAGAPLGLPRVAVARCARHAARSYIKPL
jgi:hypothetical protein